jgi:hypothetical protein
MRATTSVWGKQTSASLSVGDVEFFKGVPGVCLTIWPKNGVCIIAVASSRNFLFNDTTSHVVKPYSR